MNVTPAIIGYEFIGSHGEVVNSSNNSCIGLAGQIIDETKNTFSFKCNGKIKKIVKSLSLFNFYFPDGTIVEINGKLLVGRPEDRLKKTIKRLW